MSKLRFLCIFFVSFILYSCSPQGGIDMQTSPETTNITNLVSQLYSYDELITIANYSGNIYQYDRIYPVECIRQKNATFRIAYCGEAHIAIVFFNQSGNKTLGRVFHYSPPLSNFDHVVGKALSEITNIDPEGDYTFLYTGQNIDPTSTHYTSDGYVVRLIYNSMNTVVDAIIELI